MYGIPQGSVLGPILFSLYINDLPLYITALCERFADDTSLHNHHADLNILHASLQNCIDKLIVWTEVNHMFLHPDKIKLMLITTRQKQSSLEQNDYNLLNILPLHTRLKYNKGIYMQKIMAGNAPPSLIRRFPINSSREQNKINIPRSRIDLFKSSLTFSGASLWNSLPLSVKSRLNYTFKKHYVSCLASLP